MIHIAEEILKVARLLVSEEPIDTVLDPIDKAANFTAQIANELLKQKKQYGIAKVRQNYKGTGSKRARRQLYIRDTQDHIVDVWLEETSYKIGGVITGLRGSVPYKDLSPRDIAIEIAEALQKMWSPQEIKS